MPATLFDLPLELQLLIIEDWISPFDIRTHVCFYLSHPQCASLYDSRSSPDSFWKLLCWNNGLGQLPDENTESETAWRNIATSIVRADGFCTHPQCGEALLEYNRARMREAAQHVQPFSPLRVRKDYADSARPDPHRLFAHIGFRPHTELRGWGDPSFTVDCDAHLRSPADALVEWEPPEVAKEREYLWRHPLAARSFATFVPSASVDLFSVARMDFTHHEITGTRAVTVLEVLEVVQRNLNLELTVYAVSDYVLAHQGCISRHGWSMFEILMRLRTLRGIFSICPVRAVELDGYSDAGPEFRFDLQ